VSDSVDDRALRWFVALRDADAGADERARFEAWRAARPEHDRAWREVERLWGGLDGLAEDARRPPARRRGRAATVSTAVVLTLGVAAWGGADLAPAALTDRIAALTADHASGIGERRTVRLADGSVVDLSTATAIDVDMGPAERRVRLRAGKAFFTVAPDAARPFVVTAANGSVRVLGTAFDVRLDEGARGPRATVAVTHNAVAVATEGRPIRVEAGQMVRFDADGVSAVEPADMDAVGAWRQDRLVFHDATLAEVAAELERHRAGYVRVLDEAVAARRITAVFDARRTDAAIETIARNLGLRVRRVGGLFVGIDAPD